MRYLNSGLNFFRKSNVLVNKNIVSLPAVK